MNFLRLTEDTIRQQATVASYEKGLEYYENDAVLSIVLRGKILHAEVEGSQYPPYQVQVKFDVENVDEASCDCPYDWGGWCKHIVAVLLTCIYDPEMIEQRKSLETKLSNLSREDLLILLTSLLEMNPKLINQVEGQISLFQPCEETEENVVEKRIDPAPFRRQVRDVLHSLDHMRSSEAYWQVGNVVSEVSQVLNQVHTLVKTGGGSNALSILEGITNEYIQGWLYLDDSDGYAGGFFSDLGQVWTEAILSVDLTTEERKYWADQLTTWQTEVEEYGIDDVFETAQAAALQNWDNSMFEAILEGKILDLPEFSFGESWYFDSLITAQLNVLEYQERYQEFLSLSKAMGKTARYLTMLVHLDRIKDAVEYGKDNLSSAEDVFVFSKALQETGEAKLALEIAEHGLRFQGFSLHPLASWLRDLAIQEKESALALRAGKVAFKEQPALGDYLLVCELAAEKWPEVRLDLLEHLLHYEKWGATSGKLDIFLYEGMVSEAMKIADTENLYYDTLERVVDAAIQAHPKWAIKHSKQQAEAIMNPGKSKYYHHAIKWLSKTKAAYKAAEQEVEWQVYLSGLISDHAKKYKLKPMLEVLK